MTLSDKEREIEQKLTNQMRMASLTEKKWINENARKLIDDIKTPVPHSSGRSILWPTQNLEARVIPSGVHPIEEKNNNHAIILENFFALFAKEGVVCWIPDWENYGYVVSPYTSSFREWIGHNFSFSDYVAFSNFSPDFIYLINRDMDYSIIGSTRDIIEKFEELFGGSAELKDIFDEFVSEWTIERSFFHKYISSRCGWK